MYYVCCLYLILCFFFTDLFSYVLIGTAEGKTIKQDHGVIFCENPKPSTLNTIQTSPKNLQGGQNLPHQLLFNNHFANATQEHLKWKTPVSDPPTIESNQKKRLLLCIYHILLCL